MVRALHVLPASVHVAASVVMAVVVMAVAGAVLVLRTMAAERARR